MALYNQPLFKREEWQTYCSRSNGYKFAIS